tara:strand:+ start:3870 stop:4451 length:582 start_codon:yes stop_codon:yes gene_type:complete
MNLQDLKKEMPFKWRVQSTSEYGSNCVAYIDARDVQDILDYVAGGANWQVKYEEHKGNLFASIGILLESGWVWKSDCGTESQVEKQKGEASDAFKRAAVMWGVGRFLYSLEIIKIKEVIKAGNKYHPAHNGQRIWNINEHCNKIHNSKKVKRKEALTIDKFEKAKLFTSEQIQQVLDTFRMSSEQRKDLTTLI